MSYLISTLTHSTLQLLFGKKVGNFLENKNHHCRVLSRIWKNVDSLGETSQHRIR